MFPVMHPPSTLRTATRQAKRLQQAPTSPHLSFTHESLSPPLHLIPREPEPASARSGRRGRVVTFSASTRASPDPLSPHHAAGPPSPQLETIDADRESDADSADTFTLGASTVVAVPDASDGPVFHETFDEPLSPVSQEPGTLSPPLSPVGQAADALSPPLSSPPLSPPQELSPPALSPPALSPPESEPGESQGAAPRRSSRPEPLLSVGSTFVAPESMTPRAGLPSAEESIIFEAEQAQALSPLAESSTSKTEALERARAQLEGRVVSDAASEAQSSSRPASDTKTPQPPHLLAGYESAEEYEEALLKHARSLDGEGGWVDL